MAKNDWALVIGVNQYLKQVPQQWLKGAVRDAHEFAQWLEESGSVPHDQILLCSADQDLVSRETVSDKLWAMKERLGDEGGHRLWLFFAGHGAEITSDTVLLTSKAQRGRWVEHVPGKWTADFFARMESGFDEVVLFMDCCRTNDAQGRVSLQPLFDRADSATDREKTYLYAFGAQWSRPSIELPLPPPEGDVHGVFTNVLLQGLRGDAADENGIVTVALLRAFCRTFVPMLSPGQIPDLQGAGVGAEEMELASTPPGMGQIVVNRSVPAPIQVVGPDATIVASAPAESGRWTYAPARRGQYSIEVGDRTHSAMFFRRDVVIDV